jgi:O-antigen ligase/polysaccharide polymerase Wzy-like membrane protein
MRPGAWIFTGLLTFGILALWMPERWPWSVVQAGCFALAAVVAARTRRPLAGPASVVLVIAAAWPLAQLAAGDTLSRGQTWLAALDWLTFAVVFELAVHYASDRSASRRFLRVAAIGGALLAIVAVAQKYSSGGAVYWLFPSGFEDDVLGPFVNRNQFAAWEELLFPIALWLAATRRRDRALYGVAAAAMLASVVASASRTGCALVLLETAAVTALLVWRGGGSRAELTRRVAAFGLLAATAVLVMGYGGLLDRLVAGGAESLRRDALRASFEMVKDRPWMGSGLGTWRALYPRYAGFDSGLVMNQAHNDWAQWAAEGGVPFLFLMILFAALLWKPAFRSIYGVGVVAFLLHALVDYPMQQRPALAAWLFAVASVVYAGRGATHTSSHHDVLRGVGSGGNRLSRGDPAGIQTPGAIDPSGSMRR